MKLHFAKSATILSPITNNANGKCTLHVQLDPNAGLNTVDVTLLFRELPIVGIYCNVCKFFLTYLEERQFHAVINQSYSEVGRMTTGVPQGSVVYPVIFVIYTASLHYLLESLDVFFFFSFLCRRHANLHDPPESKEKLTQIYEAER